MVAVVPLSGDDRLEGKTLIPAQFDRRHRCADSIPCSSCSGAQKAAIPQTCQPRHLSAVSSCMSHQQACWQFCTFLIFSLVNCIAWMLLGAFATVHMNMVQIWGTCSPHTVKLKGKARELLWTQHPQEFIQALKGFPNIDIFCA